MTETLDCPKCGAPIRFDPQPGDETVVCSYCQERVIIPKELRIPLPKPVVQPQPPASQNNRSVLVVIAAVAILGIVGLVTAVLLGSHSDQPATSDSVVADSSSATATVEAQATSTALQPLLAVEQSWPASFTETFTDNSHNWTTGDVRDDYVTGNRSISDGTYTWNVTSVQSASSFSYPDMPAQADFYASVDIKLVRMPDDTDADAGLIFRDSDADQTWYYFSVNDYGQYYFGWYDGSEWYTLIPETDSSAIHIGQTNRLTVGAQGSQFIFLINGQMVDHFIDESLKTGDIGVGLNLPQTGEKATVEFTNFTVASLAATP